MTHNPTAPSPGRSERIIDVRIFLPPDDIVVRLDTDTTYPVRSWVDLPIRHALEALRNELEDQRDPDDLEGTIRRAKRTIELLCPTIPAEDLEALTTRQLIGIARAFYEMSRPEGESGNPPSAGSSSASASSSPAPPASTAGATTA